MISISACPYEMNEYFWPLVVPLVEKVVKKVPDDITVESIKKRLTTGRAMLIIVFEDDKIIAINTVETVVLDSGKKVLYIPITSGIKLDEWMDKFLVVAEAIARDFKCESLRGISCRGGSWLRALNKNKDKQWHKVHEIIEYNLGEE